jgi:5'-methylthioadenosine phosphorylase
MPEGPPRATVGIFGGSGFYKLLDDVEPVEMTTPYGPPSDAIAVGSLGGVGVAFLPRHGARHQLPPAAINYRANLWAMKELGVRRVLAPTAAGSLRAAIRPGDLVVCDQFVDRTWGRADTFHADGPVVAHVSPADPYCPELRRLCVDAGAELGARVHDGGTVVVTQGPRFTTRAESRWYRSMGCDVINMTQYPEVVLARELELCYANISLITDYDAGLEDEPGVAPVSVADVERVFASTIALVRELVLRLAPRIPAERTCPCPTAMRGAVIGGADIRPIGSQSAE